MAQVLDLINDAYALIGQYDTSGTLSSADEQLGFRALNRMIASWGNDRSMVYEIQRRTLPLIAAQPAYSSAVLGAAPLRVEAQNIIDSAGVTHSLEQIDATKWSSIAFTTEPGIPYWMYIERSIALGGDSLIFNFYPTPYGGLSAQLWCWEQIAQFTNTSSTVALPPGYEDALIYNLAIRVAPAFERTPSPEVYAIAARALAAIESTNLPQTELSVAMVPTASRSGWFNWRSGEVE